MIHVSIWTRRKVGWELHYAHDPGPLATTEYFLIPGRCLISKSVFIATDSLVEHFPHTCTMSSSLAKGERAFLLRNSDAGSNLSLPITGFKTTGWALNLPESLLLCLQIRNITQSCWGVVREMKGSVENSGYNVQPLVHADLVITLVYTGCWDSRDVWGNRGNTTIWIFLTQLWVIETGFLSLFNSLSLLNDFMVFL